MTINQHVFSRDAPGGHTSFGTGFSAWFFGGRKRSPELSKNRAVLQRRSVAPRMEPPAMQCIIAISMLDFQEYSPLHSNPSQST